MPARIRPAQHNEGLILSLSKDEAGPAASGNR
jgi:hypothetical protein